MWLYLVFLHGRFWQVAPKLRDQQTLIAREWPHVAVVVPARNEAAVIAESIQSLLQQDYPGPLHVFLVDDDSSDSTAATALVAAESCGRIDRLTLVTGAALPPGWSGKVWAM